MAPVNILPESARRHHEEGRIFLPLCLERQRLIGWKWCSERWWSSSYSLPLHIHFSLEGPSTTRWQEHSASDHSTARGLHVTDTHLHMCFIFFPCVLGSAHTLTHTHHVAPLSGPELHRPPRVGPAHARCWEAASRSVAGKSISALQSIDTLSLWFSRAILHIRHFLRYLPTLKRGAARPRFCSGRRLKACSVHVGSLKET